MKTGFYDRADHIRTSGLAGCSYMACTPKGAEPQKKCSNGHTAMRKHPIAPNAPVWPAPPKGADHIGEYLQGCAKANYTSNAAKAAVASAKPSASKITLKDSTFARSSAVVSIWYFLRPRAEGYLVAMLFQASEAVNFTPALL